MSDKLKIMAAGSPMVDLLVNVDEEFIQHLDGDKGGMELVSPDILDSLLDETHALPVKALGGSAANTIFGLARLGMDTALLGKLGDDEEAKFYKHAYQALSGDSSRLKMNSSVPSGRCLSLVTPDSERTMRTDLGAAATMDVDDVTAEDFDGVTHVHVEGYLLFNEALIRHILKLARQSGCKVSVDLASFEVVNAAREILPELLDGFVDVVFSNEDEAESFCGETDPRKALDVLGGHCHTAVVKVGKKGAFIKNGGEVVKVDAKIVKAIDTTGAGDLWQAGFLYGFLQGRPLKECGDIGALLGAEVVKTMGAAIPDEAWESIREAVK